MPRSNRDDVAANHTRQANIPKYIKDLMTHQLIREVERIHPPLIVVDNHRLERAAKAEAMLTQRRDLLLIGNRPRRCNLFFLRLRRDLDIVILYADQRMIVQ